MITLDLNGPFTISAAYGLRKIREPVYLSSSKGIEMWLISVMALMLSAFNTFDIYKSRLNRIQSIKVSVRRLSAELSPSDGNLLEEFVKVPVEIIVLILNDGTRASFVDRLEVRLDPLTPNERNVYASNRVLVPPTPHQFSLLPLPLRVNWARARYDNIKVEPSFPLVVKPDDYVAVKTTGVLCSENIGDTSLLRLPAKLSLHVVYFDAEGKLASRSLFGGTIYLFEHSKADPPIAGYPNYNLQTIMAYSGITNALAWVKQRGSALAGQKISFARTAPHRLLQRIRSKLGPNE